MFKKIESINHLAVFQDFEWEKHVGGEIDLKKINIFYGRNYSGKTTLSRIFRALETEKLPEKYDNPVFCLNYNGNHKITENNFREEPKSVKVFNEDFVRENLRFYGQEKGIEPFGVLGAENNALEQEIEAIEQKLGSDKENYETGLYLKLKVANEDYQKKNADHDKAKTDLNHQLKKKATDKEIGIKYQSAKFGDQNYDVTKLQQDIKTVSGENYQTLTDKQKQEHEDLIKEEVKKNIPALKIPNLNINQFIEEAKLLIERKVGQSDKIEELAKKAIFHNWAEKGVQIHKDHNLERCIFCDNHINKERWKALEQHFDEESDSLKSSIDELTRNIEEEKEALSKVKIDKELFYRKFHQKLDTIICSNDENIDKYKKALESILKQLTNRKNDILHEKSFIQPEDYAGELEQVWQQYGELRETANNLSTSLENEQEEAKKQLRLNEVYKFTNEIQYDQQVEVLKELKIKADDSKKELDKLKSNIESEEEKIKEKQNAKQEEGQAEIEINKYLNHSCGHPSLYLKHVVNEVNEDNGKQTKFNIYRDKQEAYNLSEGERRIIAFCYFRASLKSNESHNEKPIIWIDDPISSLDNNHIFFIYSLIRSEIIEPKSYSQLFVSTHNLEFLKYLKRVDGKINNRDEKGDFMIDKHSRNKAIIKCMPDYIKKYLTEFNYLFKQIYQCANESVSDENHYVFYNFPNNARKFLEIYLFYKFPNQNKLSDKMQDFFGDDIARLLIDRINNEYSHLSNGLERGSIPLEIPEMKKAAKAILSNLKENDSHQYQALKESVGLNQENKSQN